MILTIDPNFQRHIQEPFWYSTIFQDDIRPSGPLDLSRSVTPPTAPQEQQMAMMDPQNSWQNMQCWVDKVDPKGWFWWIWGWFLVDFGLGDHYQISTHPQNPMQLYTLLQWYVVIRITFGCAKKKGDEAPDHQHYIYIYMYIPSLKLTVDLKHLKMVKLEFGKLVQFFGGNYKYKAWLFKVVFFPISGY